MKNSKYWHTLTFDVHPSGREAVSNFLFGLGSCGLEESDDEIRAFFDETHEAQGLLKSVETYLAELKAMGIPAGKPVMDQIPAQNWNEAWQEFFKPVQITDTLIVKPPWEAVSCSKNQMVIDIMPKMAFGTGTHETTQLCLQFLETLNLENTHVLDAGTGSGILSIAAVKFGAASAVGVDVDPECVENAYENAGLNDVTQAVHFQLGFENLSSPFEVITANINRGVLPGLLPLLSAQSTADTIFIFSGILAEEDSLFQASLHEHGFCVHHKKELGEWIAYQAAQHQ